MPSAFLYTECGCCPDQSIVTLGGLLDLLEALESETADAPGLIPLWVSSLRQDLESAI